MTTIELKIQNAQEHARDVLDEFFKRKMYDESNVHISNVSEVFKTAEDFKSFKDLFEKNLEKYAKDNNISTDKIIENCLDSREIRQSIFYVDPLKQNFCEKTQNEFINSAVDDIKKDNSLFLCKKVEKETQKNQYVITDAGELIVSFKLEEIKKIKKIRTSKTFDFRLFGTFENKPLHIFFFCKYTKEGGGSQDNTFKEFQDTYDKCCKNFDNGVYFVFILDGEYYRSKVNFNEYTTDKIKICDSDNIKIEILNILKQL